MGKGLTGIYKCTNSGELWLGQKLFIESKCYNFDNSMVQDETGMIFETECDTLEELNNVYKFQFEEAY